MEKPLLKESIADIVIHEHYEQRFFDLEYILEQDHVSKIPNSKLKVAAESIIKKVSQHSESCSIEIEDFIRGSDLLGSIL